MLKQLIFILILFFNLSPFCSSEANSFSIDQPIGHVNDFAGILSSEEKVSLETTLIELSDQGGPQVAIVVLSQLEGKTIEDVARKIFDSWGIGHSGKDDGVLLLIALRDRKMRIETGYGAEEFLTDSVAGRIIREEIAPFFKQGQYSQGVHNGVKAILAKFSKEPLSKMPRKSQVHVDIIPSIALVIAIIAIIFIPFIPSWTLFLGLTSLGELCICFLLGTVNIENAIIPLGYLFISLFLLMIGKLLFGKNFRTVFPDDYEPSSIQREENRYRSTHTVSSSRWSSGSGGFSGFGDGRGGGGGASGGW